MSQLQPQPQPHLALTLAEMQEAQSQVIDTVHNFFHVHINELTALQAHFCGCTTCLRLREIVKHTKDFRETFDKILATLKLNKANSVVALTPMVTTENKQ